MNTQGHQTIWELLPWYVNASLEDVDLREVAEHLTRCEECRHEVGYLRGLSQTLAGTEANIQSPEAALGELMSKIQEDEAGSSSRRFFLAPGLLGRLRGFLQRSSVEVRWLVAIQASALMVLLGLLLWRGNPQSVPESYYRTLSDPSTTAAQAKNQRVRLVFASGVDEQAMRDLLQEMEAEIVAGPTPFGVYTLELKSPLQTEELVPLIEGLRTRPEVEFAELLP